MRFTIRDILWLTITVGLIVALCIEHWRYRVAAQEAKNRAIEAELWLHKVLDLEKRLYGTLDAPKTP